MANKQNCYCIVLSADSAYLPYAAVLIASILRQAAGSDSAPRLPFVFHILTDSASAGLLAEGSGSAESQHFAAFCEAAERIYPCVVVLHAMHEEDFASIPYFSNHKNHASSYRLRLSSVIPSGTQRVLYLDSDMLACADVRELFALDLGENIAGVVADPKAYSPTFAPKKGKKSLTIPNYRNFNSGLLLLDYARYCEANIEEQCFAFLARYKTAFHDQEALNATLMGKVRYLPFAWNCIYLAPTLSAKGAQMVFAPDSADSQSFAHTFKREKWLCNLTRAEYETALESPKIIHYCDHKPWKSRFFYADDGGQPIVPQQRELWWEAAAQTPVYGAILQQNNSFDVEALDRLNALAHALNIMQMRIDRLRAPSRTLSQLWKKLRFWK
ncbi:MAG: glycosyltransferase family 8 protein [Helicobacter sp.]|nr:glycosyltransferase family 8 protein [Helicobacter sp.]